MDPITYKRQYDININEIRKMDIYTEVYKIIVSGLIVSVFLAFIIKDTSALYVSIVSVFIICLFYILLFIMPKLDKDNYDNQITLYKRELSEGGDFFDLQIDEGIAAAISN